MALSFEPLGPTPRPARPRLLVVEDDLGAVFALRHFFATAGYDVDCAAGPVEAARLLDYHPYDAVITDLHLRPGFQSDGLRVAAHARSRNPHACIVMISATATPGMADAALRSGADLYRTKPVELGELTAYFARCPRLAAPPASNEDGASPSSGKVEG